MAIPDFRSLIGVLEAKGRLHRIRAPVDKDWELTCIARHTMNLPPEHRYAIVFDNVRGFDIPVAVGAIAGLREIYAIALDVPQKAIHKHWVHALEYPRKPLLVDAGACHENVLLGDEVDLTKLPIPVWTPALDPGPYISAGCVFTKDPDTGERNVGVYRMQLKGPRRLGILILPAKHVGIHYRKYESLNRPMEVAACIGPDPTVCMTSTARIPYGMDELDVAGGLKEEPIELVKCKTVDLEVPATSEIVIEGRVPPHQREEEGPFGEFAGFMGPAGERPFIEVTALTFRDNPIYQAYIEQKPPSEGSRMKDIALEVILMGALKRHGIPGVKAVCVTEMGAQYHVVVSIKKQMPGHVKQVFHGCWSAYPVGCKQLIVVEDDCDVYDPADVEWHVATRVQPDRDIEIVSDCTGHSLDPSMPAERRVFGSKMGIDATRKHPYPPISLPPKEMLDGVRAKWDSYGLPPLPKE